MAAPIVLISSSPPSHLPAIAPTPPSAQDGRTRTSLNAATLSSPNPPSPAELIAQTRRPPVSGFQLRSGSRALPVPDGAIAGFASAGMLLREKLLELGSEPEVHEENTTPKHLSKSKSRARAASMEDTVSTVNVAAKTPKANAEVAPDLEELPTKRRKQQRETAPLGLQVGAACDGSLVDTPASAFGVTGTGEATSRVKGPTTESSRRDLAKLSRKRSLVSQGEIVENAVEVDKADTEKPAKKARKRPKDVGNKPPKKAKKTGTTSSHFNAPYNSVANPGDLQNPKVAVELLSNVADESLDLDLAPTRRRHWTPTRDTIQGQHSPTGSATSINPPASAPPVKLDLSSFAYPEADKPDKAQSDNKPVSPQRKALKRPKTITERALAPFRQPDVNKTRQALVATGDSSTRTSNAIDIPAVPTEVAKPRKSKKTQKPVPPKVKLLTPEAFGRKLERQDLLFATASQLLNESPTYLKQYQLAIKASEADAMAQNHHHTTASSNMTGVCKEPPLYEKPKTLALSNCLPAIKRPANGLWTADSRGADDEIWVPTQKRPQAGPTNATPEPNESYVDIDDFLSHSFERSSSAPPILQPPILKESECLTTLAEFPSSPAARPRLDPACSTSTHLHDRARARSILEPLNGNVLKMQRTGGSLKSSIRKLSTATESLIGTTRDSIPRAAEPARIIAKNGDQERTISLAPDPVVKRARGRPRKVTSAGEPAMLPLKKARARKGKGKAHLPRPNRNKLSPASSTSSKSFIHIDEIEDSEPDISPSPPRSSKKKAKMPALELISSQGEVIEEPPESRDAKTQFEEQRDEAYSRITEIVKAAPRTTDPSKPSWHEKILLYDPIVLEDFTAWLNSQGATYGKRCYGKGAKGKSNDKKGRVNKAKAGGTAAPEEVTNVAETSHLPLEPWMVQKWCEAHSVCCLWREGLRGGVKVRY